MTDKRQKEILICTSALQVLSAKSAMDYDNINNDSQKYVIICHPLLTNHSIKYINKISKKLNFLKPINLVDEMREMENEINSLKNKYGIINFFKITNLIYSIQQKYTAIIKNKISKIVGIPDTIYIRKNYKYLDTLFVSAFKNSHVIQIDDGWGDNLSKFWFIKEFNFYELNVKLYSFIKRIILHFLFFIFHNSLLKDKKSLFFSNIKIKKKYSIVERREYINIKSQFFNNVQSLKSNISNLIGIKILILGTTIDKRLKYSISDETQIYNKLIDKIKLSFEVGNNEILYKSHPRLNIDDWKYKKNNLNCKILDYYNEDISECFLSSPELKAVFSFGSSSLLHAHILKIKCYLVYFKHKLRHRSDNEKYLYIAKKLNMNIMYIDSVE
jgi:hypothetical protein